MGAPRCGTTSFCRYLARNQQNCIFLLVCPYGCGAMRIVAFIIDGPTVRDILDFLSVIAQWQRTKFSGQMIVSHRHKLIFIKTPETAGTSHQLNLRPISALPGAKSAFCEGGRPYGETLSPAGMATIAGIFAREISRFGYVCGDSLGPDPRPDKSLPAG